LGVFVWLGPLSGITVRVAVDVHFGVGVIAVVGISDLTAKPLAELTNGFALFHNVPFSRTAIVGFSNRQWSMTTDVLRSNLCEGGVTPTTNSRMCSINWTSRRSLADTVRSAELKRHYQTIAASYIALAQAEEAITQKPGDHFRDSSDASAICKCWRRQCLGFILWSAPLTTRMTIRTVVISRTTRARRHTGTV
jgi:hypothetical protein